MEAKVFNKGQIVIPAVLRKKYNINIGDKVNIVADKEGINIIPAQKTKSILEFAGVFSGKNNKEPDIDKITEQSFVESLENEIY